MRRGVVVRYTNQGGYPHFLRGICLSPPSSYSYSYTPSHYNSTHPTTTTTTTTTHPTTTLFVSTSQLFSFLSLSSPLLSSSNPELPLQLPLPLPPLPYHSTPTLPLTQSLPSSQGGCQSYSARSTSKLRTVTLSSPPLSHFSQPTLFPSLPSSSIQLRSNL